MSLRSAPPALRSARRAASAVLLAAALGAAAPSATAHAQGAAEAEVTIILARQQPGPIDPSLRREPALRRPPFNAFRSMKVLQRRRIRLGPGQPFRLTLPNRRTLRIELKRRLPDGRYRVEVSINRPGRRDYLPLLAVVAAPGDPFFVAGQRYQDGTLVVGVRVGRRPSR